MPQIMTTKEIAKYLKLHEITICKYAVQGRIPAIRIGRVSGDLIRMPLIRGLAKGHHRSKGRAQKKLDKE